MSNKVVIQQRAQDDLYEAYLFAAKRAPVTARRWLERFLAAIDRIGSDPQSYPRAHEDGN